MELQDINNLNEENSISTVNNIEKEVESVNGDQCNANKVKEHKPNIFFRVISLTLCLSLIVGICYWKRDNIKSYINKSFMSIKTLKDNFNKLSESIISESTVDESTINVDDTYVDIAEIVEETTVRNDEIVLSSEIESQLNISENSETNENNDVEIYSLVLANIMMDLKDAGFKTFIGKAYSVDDDSYSATGIGFYDNEFNLFDTDEIKPIGFVEVTRDKTNNSVIENDILIKVESFDESKNKDILMYSYTFNDIKPSHFVCNNRYVTYYLHNNSTIIYSIKDNNFDNYNLSFGSLFDFDRKEYIYDEDVFGDYIVHSGIAAFTEDDYNELEKQLKSISLEQEKNGFKVTSFTIAYISPDNIKAYLDGKERDTFFGYDVNELEQAFGKGNILQYGEQDGFQLAKDVSENNGEIDWESVLKKVGIGSGIIIVGAALAPLTGGASMSFGCALLTITSATVTPSLCAGLGSLAINTTKEMIGGKDLKSALQSSKPKALNSFTNMFVIMAAFSSVGVNAGLIKPVSCFKRGTQVTIYKNDAYELENIENVKVGDWVLSYNEETHLFENKRVLNTYKKESTEIQYICINDFTIETTPEHPFYSNSYNVWKNAENLEIGEKVLSYNGNIVEVSNNYKLQNEEVVYNLEVEDNHNYFVSNLQILVHNNCGAYKTVDSARQAGVDKAWQREKDLIEQCKESLYEWTEVQKEEIKASGSLKGYDGAHIFDVGKLKNTINDHLIANPDNIALVTHEEHIYYLHHGSTLHETDLNRLVELLPWMADRIKLLESLMQ